MLDILRFFAWPLLFLLSLVFYFFVWLRNLAFDLGVIKPTKLSVPVISVGNIAMGGVGKTPIVLDLVARLQKQGLKPAVALRGYKSDVPAGGVVVHNKKMTYPGSSENAPAEDLFLGDEASLYREKIPDVPILVGPNRAGVASSFLNSGQSADVLLLDDGFQHRWLHRDHNIVVVPASQNNFGLFPLGFNRETPAALKRASLLVWMHTDRSSFEARTPNKALIGRIPKGFAALHCLRSVSDVNLISGADSLDANAEYTLVCALGNNEQVAATLVEAGYKVLVQKLFLRDHQKMTAEHAARIDSYGHPVVTTSKDYLRQPEFFSSLKAKIFIAELGVDWSEDPVSAIGSFKA